MDEYYHRISELLAIYIAFELRLGGTSEEQILKGNRIIYIMRKHLKQEEMVSFINNFNLIMFIKKNIVIFFLQDETRYNILRTLLYIPRFFNARETACAIFK